MKKLSIIFLMIISISSFAQEWTPLNSSKGTQNDNYMHKKGNIIGNNSYIINDIDLQKNFNEPIPTSNVPGFRDTIITATIDSAASLSSVINFGNRRPKLIFCPSVWTTANLSIKVSKDGSTWGNLYVDDIEFTMTAGASIAINCNPRAFIGIQYMQIRSGTAATPVNQGARRTISIVAGNY